jgi:hypothetical protein
LTSGSPRTAGSGRLTWIASKTTSTNGGRHDRRNAPHRPCAPRRAARTPPRRPTGGRLAGAHRARAASGLVPLRRDRGRWTLGGRRGHHLPVPARGHRPNPDRRGARGRRAQRPRLHLGRRHAAFRALTGAGRDTPRARRRAARPRGRPQRRRLGNLPRPPRRPRAPEGWQADFERYAAAFEPALGPQEGPPAGYKGDQPDRPARGGEE